MKKFVITAVMIFLLLTIPSISAVEYQETIKEYKSIAKEKMQTFVKTVESKTEIYLNNLKQEKTTKDKSDNLKGTTFFWEIKDLS